MNTFQQVQEAESRAVSRRRQEAGFDNVSESSRRTVGLALSGGGIRSAAFNLGLLQSFGHLGLLRHVDYLSAVSGGGYVASYLASFVTSGAYKHDDAFDAAAGDVQRSSPAISRLVQSGMYLHRPLAFANRYLVGWLMLAVIIGSFLVMVTSLAAFLFRMLDWRPVLNILFAIGVRSDVTRAFVPAMLVFLVWTTCWVFDYAIWHAPDTSRIKYATKSLLASLFLCLALAIVALLGTGDISLSQFAFQLLGGRDVVSAMQNYGAMGLLVMLTAALLPYLRPRQLIRSATRPRHALESCAYRMASYGALFGVPLCLFAFLAGENVSGIQSSLHDDHGVMTIVDVADWESFLEKVEVEATRGVPVSKLIWNIGREGKARRRGRDAVRRIAGWEGVNGLDVRKTAEEDERWHLGRVIAAMEEQESRWRYDYAFWPWEIALNTPRWIARIPSSIALRGELDKCEEDFVRHLNAKCLDDPELYLKFPDSAQDSKAWKTLLSAASDAGVTYLGTRKALAERGRSLTLEQEKQIVDELKILRLANWRLLKTHYGQDTHKEGQATDVIRDPGTVFAYKVTRFDRGDQGWRLSVFSISLGLFCVAGLLVNLNKTSLHEFYRDQLATTWIYRSLPRQTHPLSQLKTTEHGYPYLLINGTLNLLDEESDGGPGRISPFLFSQEYMGADDCGYKRSEQYHDGRFDLADAMAISGGAVAPTIFENPLLSIALFAFNFRLGQWVENPARSGNARWWHWPVPLLISYEFLFRPMRQRQFCFVSDGGHYENLGIEALLKRRCRIVIASDAGADRDGEFTDLMRLVRRMQRVGIVFEGLGEKGSLPLDKVTPQHETGLCQAHYLMARIRYPEDASTNGQECVGYFIYIKTSLDGDEANDLLQHQRVYKNFPNDSTFDQFFDADRFDAYRRLGCHVGEQVCQDQFLDLRSGNRSELRIANWSPETGYGLVASLIDRRPVSTTTRYPLRCARGSRGSVRCKSASSSTSGDQSPRDCLSQSGEGARTLSDQGGKGHIRPPF